MSLSDALTDILCDSKPIFKASEANLLKDKIPGCEHWEAHHGMMKTARELMKQMRNKSERRVTTTETFQLPLDKSYPIVITGHSLGAGVATILAFYLKYVLLYENVTAYCYSSPGGLLCKESAKVSESFVFTCVLGHDLIPRLGRNQVQRLITSLVDTLEESDESKWKILCKKDEHKHKDFESVSSESLSLLHSKPIMRRQESFRYKLKKSISNTSINVVGAELFPAGRFFQFSVQHECAEIPSHYCDEPVFSKRMGLDHLPNVVMNHLILSEIFSKVEKINTKGKLVRNTKEKHVQPGQKVVGILDGKHEFEFRTFIANNPDYEKRTVCQCISTSRIKKYDNILLPVPILNIAVQKLTLNEKSQFSCGKTYLNDPEFLYKSTLPETSDSYKFEVEVIDIKK